MPRRIEPIVEGGKKPRKGRGFSLKEIKAAEITAGEAKRIGAPIDTRRRSLYEDNVEILKEYIVSAKEAGIKYSTPKQTSKPHSGRAYRGLTSSGKKMRYLKHKK